MKSFSFIVFAFVAWSACVFNNQAHARGTPNGIVSTPHDINKGMANVSIGVGCSSSILYEAQVPDPVVPSFSYVIENKFAEFIVLHFAEFNLPPGDYVVIRPTNHTQNKQRHTNDTSTDEIFRYRGDEVSGAFFASALHTKSITIELFTTGDMRPTNPFTCTGFSIDNYRFLAQGSNYQGSVQEEVCGADNTREASCYVSSAQAFANANAVVRLLIHKPEGSFFCTGWLVGCEGHVVTNNHCISQQIHASNTEFEFRAQGSTCEQNCEKPLGCPGNTRARSSTLIFASDTLDYALVKLGINLSNDYGYLKLRESGAVLNERIYIPQHPSGWGKRIAMKDDNGYGRVESLNQGGCTTEQVAYSLDTMGGSSGSPVIAWSDHAVVALHHCGGCPNTAINAYKLVRDWRARGILPNCAVYQPPTNPPVLITPPPAPVPPPVPPPAPPSPSIQRVFVDGTIFSTSTTTSIDYTDFTLGSQGIVEIDILSSEEVLAGSSTRYVDVNNDCNSGYIDSSIVLFRVNSDGGITSASAIAANNDAPYGYGMNDGSISSTDSYIRVQLPPGQYRVAVGSAPMTVDQAVSGTMPIGSSPRICSAPLSNYGSYRLTVSSNAQVAIARSPYTYIGSQCLPGYNSSPYVKCLYHKEQTPTKAAAIDGTIMRQGSTLTVDYIPFTVNQFGRVNIAVSSYGTRDGVTYVDVNGDCVSSYIDPVVYLFRRPANGASPTTADLITTGDDDTNFPLRKNILSVSFRDPFLSLALPIGQYIAIVGRYPLSVYDAINKINTGSPDRFTPESCGQKTDQGHYMVTFSSSQRLDVTNPNSFVGTKCPNNIGRTVCVTP